MTMFSNRRRRTDARRFAPVAISFTTGVTAMLATPQPARSQTAPPPPSHQADWPLAAGGALRNGVSDDIVAPPLSLLWRFTGAPQSGDQCAPIIANGTAFYAARGDDSTGPGALYALDIATGAKKWRFDLVGHNLFTTAPTFDNGVIYIGASDGNVYAVDANTGLEKVHYHTSKPITASPIVADGVLYFGGDDGTLYALDPQTGNRVWHSIYRAGDSINSEPVVAGSFVYITTADNTIQAIKQATGIGRWNFRMPFRVMENGVIYSDSTLYVAAGPRLVAFQPTSGSVRWDRDVSSDILCPPVGDNGAVYVITRDEAGNGAIVHAVRSANGKDAWKKAATIPVVPAAAPTISGNVMYIPTVRNMLVAVSLDDGHILWQYRVDASVNRPGVTPNPTTSLTAPVAIAGGALYSLSDDGALSCYRPDAPDKTGPNVYSMYPAPAARVNGAPPLILASYVTDYGTGVDPQTMKMTLDDKDVDAKYDPYSNLISYKTRSTGKIIDQPLSNGRHSATVTIADWKGNVTTQTWSFVVDNTVSRYTKTVPPPGSAGVMRNRMNRNIGPGGGFDGPPPRKP